MLTQIEEAFAEKSASEERLRQFVADASHELRTPLTSIRGLRRAARPGRLLRRGGPAQGAQADRGGGDPDGRPGRGPAAAGRARPGPAAPGRAGRPAPHLRRRGGRLERRAARPPPARSTPGPPVVVLGDGERLAQVAHNLVRNALAHTPPGTDGHGVDGRGRRHGLHRGVRQRAGHPARRGRPASSTASTRATPPARRRGPGWVWPSCGPSPRPCTGRPRCVSTPGPGATLLVKIPLAGHRTSRRPAGRAARRSALTAAALRRRARRPRAPWPA